MSQKALKDLAVNYSFQVFTLTCLLFFSIKIWGPDSWQTPSLVGFAFTLLFYVIDGWVWYWVASRHKDFLSSFFTGTSGLRFLLSLAVLGIYYLVAGKAGMIIFLLVFVVYYMVTLAHHAIFFSRVSKRLQRVKN
ncbi:MAG: hypothetical protein E7107_15175 [Prevotella sp.]|jgi:hypothetical protein|nr:hypothetical protein [Prevotella sp.]